MIHDKPKIDLIKEADALVQILKNSLPSSVSPATVSCIAKPPYFALSIRELSLHRMANLAVSSLKFIKEKDLVPGAILLRSMVETVAIFYCFYKELIETNQKGDANGLFQFMNKTLLGRSGFIEWKVYPHAIGKLITQVSNDCEHFDSYYGSLSGIAHPTYDGLLDAYGTVIENPPLLNLGNFAFERKSQIYFDSFIPTVKLFIKTYNDIIVEIMNFADLCEMKILEKNKNGLKK
jgi:hypothetical protein